MGVLCAFPDLQHIVQVQEKVPVILQDLCCSVCGCKFKAEKKSVPYLCTYAFPPESWSLQHLSWERMLHSAQGTDIFLPLRQLCNLVPYTASFFAAIV